MPDFFYSTKFHMNVPWVNLKGGYLDFSHLTELKNIYITEIYVKKTIQIINN